MALDFNFIDKVRVSDGQHIRNIKLMREVDPIRRELWPEWSPFYIYSINQSVDIIIARKGTACNPNLEYAIGKFNPTKGINGGLTWTAYTGTWQRYDTGVGSNYQYKQGIHLKPHSSLYIRGNNSVLGINYPNNITIFINGVVSVGGDLTSLLQPPGRITNTGYPYTFFQLFYQQAGIVDAHNLIIPLKTINDSELREMFAGCANLENTPDLYRIAECSGTENFSWMFGNCYALKIPPAELNITTGGTKLYRSMFTNCRNLKYSPKIFLKNNPTSWGENMFLGCNNLREVAIPNMTIWNDFNSKNWLAGTSTNGYIYRNSSLGISGGPSGCPNGWLLKNYNSNIYLGSDINYD